MKGHRRFSKGEKSQTTSVQVLYENTKTGKVVKQPYYRDIAGVTTKPGNKRKLLLQCRSWRNKTILKNKSRLHAYAIVNHLDLVSKTHSKQDDAFWQTFVEAIEVTAGSYNEWKMVDSTLNYFEIVLLEWGAMHEDNKNHEAPATHVDKNPNHMLESMTMFGKVPSNFVGTSTRAVEQMVPGRLAMPLQGFTTEMRCGRDVMHLQLRNSPHAADNTRNHSNFSNTEDSHEERRCQRRLQERQQ